MTTWTDISTPSSDYATIVDLTLYVYTDYVVDGYISPEIGWSAQSATSNTYSSPPDGYVVMGYWGNYCAYPDLWGAVSNISTAWT